jgi:hypothetical protein
LALAASIGAWAAEGAVTPTLRSDHVHTADAKKTQAYVADGLFVGGDRAIDDVVVKDIRRAANKGYERMVIDLEGTRGGEPAAIKRPPYYQVAVSPEEKRLVVTIWGRPKLAFDSWKVIHAFAKSPVVANMELLPKVDEDSWTFVVGLKMGKPVEVFELGDHARIIVDIRTDRR